MIAVMQSGKIRDYIDLFTRMSWYLSLSRKQVVEDPVFLVNRFDLFFRYGNLQIPQKFRLDLRCATNWNFKRSRKKFPHV